MGHRFTLGIAIASTDVPFWVARLIEEVGRVPCLELRAVLVCPSEVVRSNLLRACQLLSELKPYYRDRAKPEDVRGKLGNAELIEFGPLAKDGDLQHEQVATIQALGLDILLNLALPSVRGAILSAVRHSVWEFTSRGAPVQSHLYVGFWEAYHAEPLTKIALRGTTPDGRKHVLLETQVRTKPNSLSATNNRSLESAITLLRYAAERLARNRSAGLQPLTCAADAIEQTVVAPAAGQLLRFAARSSLELIAEQLGLFGRRVQWSIGILPAAAPLSLTTEDLARVQWLMPDRSRFLADPFLIEHKGRKYIFLEEYKYRKRKGIISVIELGADGRFSDPRPVLEADFHLSFPFVFEKAGRMYMVPEQAESGQVVLYEAIVFPDQWQPRSLLVDSFAGWDNVLFEHQGSWWLFTSRSDYNNGDNNLHLFHSSTLFDRFEPHPCNPVKIDLSGSRMAGRILRQGKRIVRPAQNCSHHYGGSVVFQEILALDETRYEERFLREVRPSPRSPFGMAFHTVNTLGDTMVVDGYRLAVSLPPVGG